MRDLKTEIKVEGKRAKCPICDVEMWLVKKITKEEKEDGSYYETDNVEYYSKHSPELSLQYMAHTPEKCRQDVEIKIKEELLDFRTVTYEQGDVLGKSCISCRFGSVDEDDGGIYCANSKNDKTKASGYHTAMWEIFYKGKIRLPICNNHKENQR